MNLNDYQTAALHTAMEKSPREIIEYCAHGLSGEAGEVSEIIKKHYYHGHDLSPQQLMDEIGDVMWYAAVLSYALGFTIEYVAERNLAKLAKRYPEGFSEERSRNRTE
jgi:NTP pyrophosphatase (non-canonical NTP hydrolase)